MLRTNPRGCDRGLQRMAVHDGAVLLDESIFPARLFSLALAACVSALMLCPSALAQVRLTEFSAANATGLTDEDGSVEDWIEIANLGPATVNLAGWHSHGRFRGSAEMDVS